MGEAGSEEEESGGPALGGSWWILLWHRSTEGYRAELFPTHEVSSLNCLTPCMVLPACSPALHPPGPEQPAWSLSTRLVTSLPAGCVMMALLPACLPACLPPPPTPRPWTTCCPPWRTLMYAWCWNPGSQNVLACLPAWVSYVFHSPPPPAPWSHRPCTTCCLR
jgi:hypothetical protein